MKPRIFPLHVVSQDKAGTFIKNSIPMLFLMVIVLALNGCGGSSGSGDNSGQPQAPSYNSKILGTWISSTIDGAHDTHKTITFHSDGTAKSNCADETFYTWSGSGNAFTLTLTTSNDPTDCSISSCTSITLDATGTVLTSVCDKTTVFHKNSDGIVIESGYLQYRTCETASKNSTRGWLNFSKSGEPINASDTFNIVLKNSQGSVVNFSKHTFHKAPYFFGLWNPETSTVDFSGPLYNSGYSIEFDATPLPSDLYTFEVTKTSGEVLPLTLNYPGQTAIPIVLSSNINTQWLSNGGLEVSWTPPAGTYDRHVVFICDQDGKDIFYAYLANSVTKLVIPADIISAIDDLMKPESLLVQLQTRVYADTADKNNYARSLSNQVVAPWQSPSD